MPETKIDSAVASNLTNAITDFSVAPQTTDAADQDEFFYDNAKWAQYLGYYKQVPELTAAIDAKATWTVGKGFTADDLTILKLDTIRGWGKDTFNTILENMIRTYHIGGDAFAEIIIDQRGQMINLKPLDPGTIRIVGSKKGRIKRYEQITKTGDGKINVHKKFEPFKMFHLARNRVADEIHGQSIITSVEKLILMRNEAMDDYKRVLHRNVRPVIIWHLDTDDTAKIADFKAKQDAAKEDQENIYIPKGAVEPEVLSIAPNATLNPLPWIERLSSYFFQAVGIPDIIVGGSPESLTEASSKIKYLAFQQTIEEEQLFVEEQVLAQLGEWIKLTFPADLTGEALSDKPREEEIQQEVSPPSVQQGEKAVEPNDMVAELEGRK